MFDCPNLDGLSIDPADYDQVADVLRRLALYAERKAHAMRARLAGDVNEALRFERMNDAAYEQLPQWARW